MEQSTNTLKQLDQMQLTFIDLAQQVHNIRATVNYETSEVDEPPFDGYRYIWNWNGITIRFCGSNYLRVPFMGFVLISRPNLGS